MTTTGSIAAIDGAGRGRAGTTLALAAAAIVLVIVFHLSQTMGGVTWDQALDRMGVEDQVEVTRRWIAGDGDAHYSQVRSNFAFYGIAAVLPGYVAELVAARLGWANPGAVFTYVVHATAFACSLLTLACTWLILRRATGRRAEAAAGVALLGLYPLWLGFSFFNHKDIPIAAFATMALLAAVGLLTAGDDRRTLRRSVVLLAVATVLIAGVRLPGLAMAVPAWIAATVVLARQRRLGLLAATGAATAAGIFAITPVAWSDPVNFLFDSVALMSRHTWNGCTLADGECMAPHAPDWSAGRYLFAWFSAQLPVLIAVGAIGGLLTAFRRGAVVVTIAATAVLPLLLIVGLNSTLYDGLRHVLFVIPPIFILAVLFWGELARRSGGAVIGVFLAAQIALFVADNIAMFPYNYVSFNLPTRMVADASTFETDLWGFSLREAAETATVASSDAVVIGNPVHLVARYVPTGRPVFNFADFSRIRSVADAVLVSYTRGFRMPAGCVDPEYVTRRLPLSRKTLRLSLAVRCARL